MKNIKKLYIVGVLTFGCAFVALLSRNSFSQTSAPQQSEAGRYQLVSNSIGVSSQIILLDTKTGRVWAKTAVYSPTKKTYEAKWIEDSPFAGKSSPQ